MNELDDLSRQNDELINSKDSDLILIRDLGNQLKEYKRKYEQAKTELRSIKGKNISLNTLSHAELFFPLFLVTSQLFLPPKFDKTEDQLPVSPDGVVLDIHITAFQSAIDDLLTAGRSNAPTRVLSPMKSVVNAVTNIIEDVKIFERRPQHDRSDVDADTLRSLQERAEATLSNLVAATNTHATSSGMSPVSLLDAAASHVSLTITEIGRTVCIRKATKAEQDQFSNATLPGPSGAAANAFSPVLRSVEEMRFGHQRKLSQESTSSRLGRFSESPSSSLNYSRTSNDRRRPPSENSSSEQTNSPPPIFDTHSHSGGVVSDDSAQAESSEDAWAELKVSFNCFLCNPPTFFFPFFQPYLEAQTESIVYAIQSVLSGVRSPTPSPKLNENLTEIITIVSSIVAVCKDNLPPASLYQGSEILRELGEHANKLSEVQALPEVTKESRQIMAKSSFAIANSMKGLMKL
jgi:protein SPA2